MSRVILYDDKVRYELDPEETPNHSNLDLADDLWNNKLTNFIVR